MRVHSRVGLITNSSSEVYTFATGNAVDDVKRIINAVLSAGGSDKTCDDLFEVSLERKSAYYVDEIIDDPDFEPGDYISEGFSEGLMRVVVKPRPGVVVSSDLGKLFEGLYGAEEFGWG